MITEPDRLQVFAADFLNFYLERGLGSLTKKDIDLHIFHLISRIEELDANSNHQMALDFKITPTKIKTLRFERNLKYQHQIELDVKKEFFKCLSKAKLKIIGANNWIALNIENTFVREGIKAKLKEIGHFSDGSFNSEIVSIEKDAFLDLIEKFYQSEIIIIKDLEKLSKEIKKVAKLKEPVLTFRGLFDVFIEGVVQAAANKSVDMGLSALTGGAADGLIIINKINDLFKK
jgi:hypothetical protein